MITIIHATTYDYDNLKRNQYIEFDTRILSTGDMKDCPMKGQIIDVEHALVMPGMINAHSHIYSTFARGVSVKFSPQSFKELLEQLWWKLDHHLTNEMTYYSGIVATVEHLKNGVTTIIDHHASGEIKGALEQLKQAVSIQGGMRGAFCFETSDRYNIDECITENNHFIEHNNTVINQGFFGLHASFTLSDDTLQKVHQQTSHPIHIHVAESVYDQEHAINTYRKTPVQRLYENQLLTKNSLLAHCIHVSNNDLNLMKQQDVSVVVNVTSNMNNGVGLPDVLRFMKHDIPVIIGNDGISYSMAQEYLSLYFAMHHKYCSPTAFTPEHLRQLIKQTYNYASHLFDLPIGRIEKDYAADLIVLPYNPPTPIHSENMMGHLLFGVYRNHHPNHVFIGGKQVVKDRCVPQPLQEEYNHAQQAAQACWDSIAKGEMK
jgi:putative selenium metabolism protein SsnA